MRTSSQWKWSEVLPTTDVKEITFEDNQHGSHVSCQQSLHSVAYLCQLFEGNVTALETRVKGTSPTLMCGQEPREPVPQRQSDGKLDVSTPLTPALSHLLCLHFVGCAKQVNNLLSSPVWVFLVPEWVVQVLTCQWSPRSSRAFFLHTQITLLCDVPERIHICLMIYVENYK
jgi:hypothetical protein